VNWEATVNEWSKPPVDDVGYIPSTELMAMGDDRFGALMETMRTTRYTGWRNHGNRWRDVMGLDSLEDKDILDFGCGVGVDALELGLMRNRVQLADLSQDNVDVSTRTMGRYNIEPEATWLVSGEYPFLAAPNNSIDVFYCNGVLHHIPWAREIMERAHELLRTGGEVRLMVYSDLGWRHYIRTNPPAHTPSDPNFQNFIRIFDQVGFYADWYNEAKLVDWFGDLFEVERLEYLTDNDRYLAAVLRKKEA